MSDKKKQEEKQVVEPNTKKRSCPGFWWGLLGLVLIAGLVIFGVYAYTCLVKTNHNLAKKIIMIKTQSSTTMQLLQNQSQQLAALEKELDTLKNTNVMGEKIIAEWQAIQKGDIDKWRFAQAQYLVNLANDYIQFTHDNKQALILLLRAKELLQILHTNDNLSIMTSLAEAITHLQSEPVLDLTETYQKLMALDQRIDALPLLLTTNSQVMPSLVNDSIKQVGWSKMWSQFLSGLSKIVVIKKNAEEGSPLILPDEKIFIYQNLHAKIAIAKWALLQRNQIIYKSSLQDLQLWIQRYVVQDAELNHDISLQLQTLMSIDIESNKFDLSELLSRMQNVIALPANGPDKV